MLRGQLFDSSTKIGGGGFTSAVARNMKNQDTKFPSTIKIHYKAQTPKRKKVSGYMKNRGFSNGRQSGQCTKGDEDDF